MRYSKAPFNTGRRGTTNPNTHSENAPDEDDTAEVQYEWSIWGKILFGLGAGVVTVGTVYIPDQEHS